MSKYLLVEAALVLLSIVLSVAFAAVQSQLLLLLAFLSFCASFIYYLVKFRCPHCGRVLFFRNIFDLIDADYCPYCGDYLDI